MSYQTIQRLVMNSETDRQTTDSTDDFVAYFKYPIAQEYHDSRQIAVCATTVSVPNTAFQISYANSHIYFQTRDTTTSVVQEHLLQINYNRYYGSISDFVAYLQAEFWNQHSFNIAVSYDDEFKTIIFTNNVVDNDFRLVSDRKYEPYGLNGSVLVNRGNMKFGLMNDYRNQWVPNGGFVIAGGECILRRTDVIHITSDTLETNTFTPSGYASAPILLTVPAGPFGTQSVFSPTEKHWHIINDNVIDSFKIKLVDSEFIDYNTRESNVMIILEFAIYYPPN